MSLIKTPELYKCGLAINGVMDFVDLRSDYGGYVVNEMLNSKWDARSVSPYHKAKNIKAPLLLIASEKDAVVAPENSYKMHKRLRKLGKKLSLSNFWMENTGQALKLMRLKPSKQSRNS